MSAKVERLVNLTIALLESRRPLPLADLKRRTGYYGQDDTESARRMFERDKDELRGLGVPIRVAHDPLTGEAGYIVDRRDYELPDVDLTREETAALAVAMRLTGQADDRLALSKLAARAPDPLADPAALDARLSLDTAAVDEVADALVERRTLRFAYRRADGSRTTRTVDPYGVGMRRGAWYVVGRDHDRDDLRAFRLDRIVGAVATASDPGAFEPPDGVDVAGHIAGPAADTVEVTVAVAPAARWLAESRGGIATGERVDGWTVHRFPAADPARLVPWLLGLGPDVVVRSPEPVRASVQARLRATLEAL